MATSDNLSQLQQGKYDNQRLADAKDSNGSIGECVSLVEKMIGYNTPTTGWKKGENVITNGNVAVGTVIATFKGNGGTTFDYDGYHQHTGIFSNYIRNSSGNIIGFEAWNQNYPVGSGVHKSSFLITGDSNWNSDADDYYVVQ